jgi:hypothetical protein
MTRACLKDVFNRRDLSSLDKYMSAGEFFPNWPKKKPTCPLFPQQADVQIAR